MTLPAVIKRMMDVIQEIERQLLMVLLENIPEPAARPKRENESLLNGPQLDTSKAGVVASQIRWTICWIALVSDCPFCLRSLTRPEAAQNKTAKRARINGLFPPLDFLCAGMIPVN